MINDRLKLRVSVGYRCTFGVTHGVRSVPTGLSGQPPTKPANGSFLLLNYDVITHTIAANLVGYTFISSAKNIFTTIFLTKHKHHVP